MYVLEVSCERFDCLLAMLSAPLKSLHHRKFKSEAQPKIYTNFPAALRIQVWAGFACLVYLHGLAENLIALLGSESLGVFVATILDMDGRAITFFALDHIGGRQGQLASLKLLNSVTSDGTLNIVESPQTLKGDDAHLIVLRLSGLGHANDAATLVLREDVAGTRCLGHGSTLVVALLELLQSAVMKSTLGLRRGVLIAQLLVETVTNALAEGIDASVAACLRLLVAHTLVVIAGVEGASARCELYGLALSRHLTVRSIGGALANVCAAGLRHGVGFVSSASVRSLVELDTSVASSCKNWVLHAMLTT